MTKKTSVPTQLFLLIGLFLFAACAHIPMEAPELSAELGSRITAIEKAHFNLLRLYFEEKRGQVDRFITDEWLPTFAEEIFSDPRTEEVWGEIVRSNNEKDRAEFLNRLGPRLQERVYVKRAELIKPLDDLERLLEMKLSEEYEQAMAINNSIMGLLLSASKVEENRKKYLGITEKADEKFSDAFFEIESALDILLNRANTAMEKGQQAEEYFKRLQSLVGTIKR